MLPVMRPPDSGGQHVLVISPHCDDETFGMGGTICKLRDGGSAVTVVVVACGDIQFDSGKTVARDERVAEFEEAKRALGFDGHVLGFVEESQLDRVPIGRIVSELDRIQDRCGADIWYVAAPS